MKKLFEFCEHIGKWRVLVQTRDVADGAITGKKLANLAVDWWHIVEKAVWNIHLADQCVDSRALADGSVKSRHIAPGEVKEVNIGDGEVKSRHIGNGEVKTVNIDDGAVTDRKLDPSLLNEIRSAAAHGYALANTFGGGDDIGVSQKTLTDAINKLWGYLEEKFGEILQGINMVVSPTYFIGEDGCDIHIEARTVETNGIFEKIAFYADGELITNSDGKAEAENVDYFAFDAHIDKTTVIKCVAQIMGIEYTRQEVITHYNSFWLGAGSSYDDIMNLENIIPIRNGMRGAYNVNVGEGEHIIIVVGESLQQGFIRADINSVEIPFDESTVTVGGERFRVFTSVNTYIAGRYNVDING